MRKLLGTLGLALALAPAAAFAATDTDSKDVNITGTVAALCVLGAPSDATVDLEQMAETSGSRVGRLKSISQKDVTLADSFCNFANSAVTVTATALVADDTNAPPSGFVRAINYTATATGWTSPNAAVTTADDGTGTSTSTSGTGGTQPTPKLSDIVLSLSDFTAPGDKLLVFGDYNTTVTVTLAPEATPK